MSFQAKLIFQDENECGKKVGILYMKFCSDVHTMMGTSHIKKLILVKKVSVKINIWMETPHTIPNQGWDTAPEIVFRS